MKWAYGVTTVPSRRETLLPKTLASLKEAGFSKPRLFVDGADLPSPYDHFELETTLHYPTVRCAAQWVLSAWELYARDPWADRYAIFQDDFVTYPHLRDYLESCSYPQKGYWNLFTFPHNHKLAEGKEGWHPSDQYGKGAVALVFSNPALMNLLTQPHLICRFRSETRGHHSIDGGIVESFRKLGWKEFVHNPSLVQHMGEVSTVSHRNHPQADSFRGENYDAREMIKHEKS